MNFELLAQKFDQKKVLQYLRNFSGLLKEGYQTAKKSGVKGKLASSVIVCGMGGSAISAFILQNLFKLDLRIPITVENSYFLPRWANQKTLAIFVSYSGKTKETLACLKQARNRKCFMQGISGNADFKKPVKETVIIPNYFPQTRFAFPYLFASLFFLLEKSCLPKKQEQSLFRAAEFITKERKNIEQEAKRIARKLQGKLPIVIAPHHLRFTALKWVQDLNENSKSFAFFSHFSELNHNGINAIHGLQKGILLFWREENEEHKTKRRREISEHIFKKNCEILRIQIKGNTLLEKTLYAANLGSFVSYFLAMLYQTDPEPVPGNEMIKKAMA